jgi:hypothetical protein
MSEDANEHDEQGVAASTTQMAVVLIERKRVIIEEVANIIRKFQHLTTSLGSLLYAGGPNNPVMERAFEFLDTLEADRRNLPSDKVELRLEQLENKLRGDLRFFLELVLRKVSPGNDDPARLLPAERIEEFRRRVRLALSYRILLIERGEKLPPFALDVPTESLVKVVKNLRIQEQVSKKRFIHEMQELQSDLQSLAANKALPATLREQIADMQQGLVSNIAHVEGGGSVDTLPLVVEDISIADVVVSDRTPESTNTALTGSRSGESGVGEDGSTEIQDATDSDDSGFMSRVGKWLDTPLAVSWDDIKNDEHKKKAP